MAGAHTIDIAERIEGQLAQLPPVSCVVAKVSSAVAFVARALTPAMRVAAR